MIKDITLGQYFPGNSILHRLDPRMKLVLTIFFVTLLFCLGNFLGYMLFTVLTIIIVYISKIPFSLVLRSIRPLFFIILFTTALNIFLTPGDVILKLPLLNWTVTMQGVEIAVTMILRIVYLIIGTSMLTYTTSPIMLTDAIESLLSPLKKLKVPVHEFAMMMTIALRFIPTLIEETDKIINAQKARGADFETGGLIKRSKALIPILVPLFVYAFRRAIDLAVAMECRCYKGGEGRTKMKQYHLKLRDFFALFFMVDVTVIVVVLNIVGAR